MEAASITEAKNMIIELIRQPLFEKIEETIYQILDSLIQGLIYCEEYFEN